MFRNQGGLARHSFMSLAITMIVFGFGYGYYAYSQELETLTLTVATELTFTATTDNFGTITPGTPGFATTTLNLTTNNVDGWNVTLSGDDQGTSNTVCDLNTDASVGITDQTEWVPGIATTSAGNAVQIGSLDSSAEVLAFRVMTASGSTPFTASSWWGAADNYTDSASTLWAGIASSTVGRQIGNAGAGSYQAGAHLNSVLYYLNVSSSQNNGDYTCPLTYTAVANV